MSAPASSPAEWLERIRFWQKQRQAVILAHNYQNPEVQDMADFTGDSLELSRRAAQTDAAVIVFCGVHFMAESAKILSPAKTVLLPAPEAGCPMAEMADLKELQRLKASHPQAAVVAYVNSAAEIKAESDVCCTSANAVEVVNALPHSEIIFVPDQNLGHWVSLHTAKKIILWEGFCATHARATVGDVLQARAAHPGAEVLVHPECRPEVCAAADEVLSTSGMLRHAHGSEKSEFILGTEIGLLHPLRKQDPEKRFYPLSDAMVCPNMKLTTLEDVARALETLEPKIAVAEAIRKKAARALEKMLELL